MQIIVLCYVMIVIDQYIVTKRKKTEIIAEKVTFLTSNPQRRKIENEKLEELSEKNEKKQINESTFFNKNNKLTK